MKQIIWTLLVLALAVGCKKNEVIPANITAMVGTWVLSSWSISGCRDNIGNFPEGPCINYCDAYIFTTAQATYDHQGKQMTGNYTIKGDSIYMPFMTNGYKHFSVMHIVVISSKMTLKYNSGGSCISQDVYAK